MKVVVQRVTNASVSVDNKLINKVDKGYMLLVSFTNTDDEIILNKMAKKIANLRIFDDENGVMNKSILDSGGSILSISQFTLYADTKKGNRPSYIMALPGSESSKLYDIFNEELNKYVKTVTGVFGAEMLLNIKNDGPITIIIDSKNK